MPFLIPPRIYCFYCGTRTQYTKKSNIRRFDCDSCEATNFLDEHGEITDVPSTPDTKSATSFATAAPNLSPSASLQASSGSSANQPFCNICLKNQHFLTQCLANYVPPASQEEYDAQFPIFKQNMEKRYPPVCLRCEPKVRERLRKSAYAAKSEILSKTLERTAAVWKGKSFCYDTLGMLEWLRGFGLAIHVAWHLLGLTGRLARQTRPEQTELSMASAFVNSPRCFAALVYGGTLSATCYDTLVEVIFVQLIFAFMTCWYNPTMKTQRRASISQLRDYYIPQALSLMIRSLTWLFFRQRNTVWGSTHARAMHASSAVMLVCLAYTAHAHVPHSRPTRPVFRDFDKPLVDGDSFQYPVQDEMKETAEFENSKPLRKPFPIDRLAPRKAASVSTRSDLSESEYRPTTTDKRSTTYVNEIEDLNSGDAMDWEPIQPQSPLRSANLRMNRPLQNSHTTTTSTSPGQSTSSPFYGQLPPAPKSMEHRLRNSANSQPAQFHPVPETRQQDWFQRMKLANSSWAAKDYVKTVADPDKREINIAESKWTLKSDLDAVARGTGLEDLFNSSFNIADETGSSEASTSVQTKESREAALGGTEQSSTRSSGLYIAVVVVACVMGAIGSMNNGWRLSGDAVPVLGLLGEKMRAYAYGEY